MEKHLLPSFVTRLASPRVGELSREKNTLETRRGLGTTEFLDQLDPHKGKVRGKEAQEKQMKDFVLLFERNSDQRSGVVSVNYHGAGSLRTLYEFPVTLQERDLSLADGVLSFEKAEQYFGFTIETRVLIDKKTGEETEWRWYMKNIPPGHTEGNTYVVTGSFNDHWQNSHSHFEYIESYLLLRGTLTLVRPADDVPGATETFIIRAYDGQYYVRCFVISSQGRILRDGVQIQKHMPNVAFKTGEPHNTWLSADGLIGTGKQLAKGAVKKPEGKPDWKREEAFENALLTPSATNVIVKKSIDL